MGFPLMMRILAGMSTGSSHKKRPTGLRGRKRTVGEEFILLQAFYHL